ncbi:glycosyltransferase family 2 protein [Maribacter halichondriae]|uniref:glycosyltransferase family 2 protein n=1 Tax=Maribacter halichondriae TaxID=2980554 RepID=UPI002358361C|nr:glycosyltransferase family 2 protein [Maribacter sp. Hal144]
MQQPLVSILIPFKNTEIFLPECLDSILSQRYEHWEVLAVNDHSSDESRSLVKRYSEKDARIKVFDNEGKGIIDALNTAYKHSHGQLITRMDSDDIMKSDKIKVMVDSLINREKNHVAIGQVKYFSDRGISNGYERYERWLNNLTAEGANYSEIYKECVIPSPCWMVHRNDLDFCGAFESNRYPEDYDLTFRFYEKGLTCIPCEQVLHLWRDYDTRTSRTSEHYAQNYFLDIKLHYFLKLEYDQNRPLTIWGAGNKGKEIAKGLLNKNINFYWLCDNPKKIGKEIYGKKMLPYTVLEVLDNPQSIVTVANEEAQIMIHDYFLKLGQSHMKDYFFFC